MLAHVASAVALGLLLLAGCSSSVGSGQTRRALVLTGSSTVAPLAGEIGKRFEAQRPGTRIDVQTGGSSRGIADARRGLADIGMVSRDLKQQEQDLHAFPIARDGICLITHQDNAIRSLTDEQVVEIYRGVATNWHDVGGADTPITVVTKAEGRSTLELFLDYFQLQNTEIRAHVVIGDNEQGIKTVAGNPYAIGFVSIGTAEYHAGRGTPIQLLPLGGIEASVENVRNGSFPLARTLNFVTQSEPTDAVKGFIDFARSRHVRDIIQEQYFVALAE